MSKGKRQKTQRKKESQDSKIDDLDPQESEHVKGGGGLEDTPDGLKTDGESRTKGSSSGTITAEASLLLPN